MWRKASRTISAVPSNIWRRSSRRPMERDVGIVGYLTSTPGVGGTIKSAPEDFGVEGISAAPAVAPEGRYAIAQVRVRNWETNRLVRAMARALHISRKRIGYAGTKDKHAVTTRLFSFEDVLPEAVRGLPLKDVDILDAFRSDRPLELGDLAGNRFRIFLKDLPLQPEVAAKTIEGTARALQSVGGIPSIFWMHRFV